MPSPDVQVRRALPEEHDTVADLTAGVYVAEGYAGDGYVPVLRDVAARAAQTEVLVALVAGRVVGSVTVVTGGGAYAEQAGPGEAVVRMLVVDPAARGAGVGRALMAAGLSVARRAGCSRMRLSTMPRMAAAHRLYDGLGFVRTPDHDWSPVPGLELLTYALELS